MESFLNDWGLSIPTFLPVIGAVVMMLIPKDREQLHKLIALATTVAVAVFGLLLLIQFIDNDDYGADVSSGRQGVSGPIEMVSILTRRLLSRSCP